MKCNIRCTLSSWSRGRQHYACSWKCALTSGWFPAPGQSRAPWRAHASPCRSLSCLRSCTLACSASRDRWCAGTTPWLGPSLRRRRQRCQRYRTSRQRYSLKHIYNQTFGVCSARCWEIWCIIMNMIWQLELKYIKDTVPNCCCCFNRIFKIPPVNMRNRQSWLWGWAPPPSPLRTAFCF